MHWCKSHRPFLSGGIDTLTTAFTCLLYSLEAINLRDVLFSSSCFVNQVFKTQDLLSHLGKNKNCLLKEYSAKYLCLYAQDAHARPLIWNTLLTHAFWQTNIACKLTSVILPSVTCGLILCSLPCTISQMQNYIIWVATPQRLLSSPLTWLKIDQLCGIILFILSNLLLHQAKLNGHWYKELWSQTREETLAS